MSTPMTKTGLTVAALAFTTILGCGAETEAEAVSLESTDARLSYGIGLRMGERMAADAMTIDVAAYAAGLEDAMTGVEPKLTEEDGSFAICRAFICVVVVIAICVSALRHFTSKRSQ